MVSSNEMVCYVNFLLGHCEGIFKTQVDSIEIETIMHRMENGISILFCLVATLTMSRL